MVSEQDIRPKGSATGSAVRIDGVEDGEGRLLLIAPTAYSLTNVKLTRRNCEMMNNLATDVASVKVTLI